MKDNEDLNFGETLLGLRAGMKLFHGRYSLEKRLGRGGMGEVWLAEDSELERKVALKFLPEVVARDPAAIRDLKREAKRAFELTHANVVRIYDFLSDGNYAGISMEYINGESLALLKSRQPEGFLEWDEISQWLGQLFSAMEFAHEHAKIVHRDLKPANVLMTQNGMIKVADFGISASITDSVSRVSVQGSSSGTPVYMSPQQMMGDDPSVADDVYSLGAMLYELLTGKPPFYSGNLLLQVQNKTAPSVADRRKSLGVEGDEVPAHVETVIAACLSKEPSERPSSIAELKAMFDGKKEVAVKVVEEVEEPKVEKKPVVKVEIPKSVEKSKPVEGSGTKSKGLMWMMLVVLVLGPGYFYGIYKPEQNRQAELAQLEYRAQQTRDDKERIRLANARGGLIIRTDPSGAEVRIGGSSIGTSPVNLGDLKLGTCLVEIHKDGYRVKNRKFEVKEGVFTDPGTITLDLLVGSASIESKPSGADVYMDGVKKGSTPMILKALTPGNRELELRFKGYQNTTTRFSVKADETTKETVSLKKIVGPEEKQNYTVPDLGLELVWINPGSFTMGSPSGEEGRYDNENQHKVRITKGYWLGKYEVTQGEWKAIMGNNPSNFTASGSRAPVERVSWDDVQKFCKKLTQRERAAGRLPSNLEYALPTEAEWEYACRADTTGSYAGSSLDSMGWYRENSGSKTHPVGQKRANAWGLYDMHGNVWEWCSDKFGDYPSGSVTDPRGASSGSRRVDRGGSWSRDARGCRSARRDRSTPVGRYDSIGFRLAVRSI